MLYIYAAPLSEDHRLLNSFTKAIDENGYLIQTVMQAILHGNAGFGKTSLLKSLLGIKPNIDEMSTGVMEEPKQIKLSTVSIEGSDASIHWTHIEDLKEEAALLVRNVNNNQIDSCMTPEKQKRRIIEAKEYEAELRECEEDDIQISPQPGLLEFLKFIMDSKRYYVYKWYNNYYIITHICMV